MTTCYRFIQIWLCLDLPIGHIVQVNFIDIRLLILLWTRCWVVMSTQQKLLSLSIRDLLHHFRTSGCWLSHLRLTSISSLPHLVVQYVLAVTLLWTWCQWIVSSYLLIHILELLTLAYLLILLTYETLSASWLAFPCGLTTCFASALDHLGIVSFEKVLTCLLAWSTFWWEIVVELVVLFLNTLVSSFRFALLASVVANQVLIGFAKTCFWKIRTVLTTVCT